MLRYISKFLKELLNKKTVEPPQKSSSWSDILSKEIENSESVTVKRPRIMLLPSRSVIMWKTDASDIGSKKSVQPGVNFVFKFDYDGDIYSINVRRPNDQILKNGLLKIRANMLKKLQYAQKSAEEINAAGKVFTIDAISKNGCQTEDIKMLDLLDKDVVKHFIINNQIYNIQFGAPPIIGVNLELTALSNTLLMPSIDFSPELSEIEKSKVESQIQCHWFVRDEIDGPPLANKNNVIERSTRIDFEDEEKRMFSISGFSLKHIGPYFQPKEEYVEHSIIVVVDAGILHPVRASISTRATKAGPDEFVTNEQFEWCQNNLIGENDERIRLMTYNILADNYLNLKLEQDDLFFKYCPKPFQRYFYRTPILMKQLKDFAESSVSIMFLQEVDKSRINPYYLKLFDLMDFGFDFCKKRLQIGEGLVIAYSRKRFKSIESFDFGIAELITDETENEDVRAILDTSPEVKNRVLTRGTVLQVVLLEDLASNSLILCANTHLHHNPKEEYIKILQTLVLVRKIYRIKDALKNSKNQSIRVLIGGDFNSVPSGPVFELLSKGKLSKNHESWKLDENIISDDIMLPNGDVFSCLSGIHKYTNYTDTGNNDGFIGCLDYIWGREFETSRICPMPSHSKIVEFDAIPSKNAPSDHIPVIVDVQFVK